MFSRNHLFIGAAALTPSFAGEPPIRALHLGQRPQLVQPDRAAQCEWIDGRIVLTSDWVELGATTRNPPDTYAYDAFEGDENRVPTDDAPFGCSASVPPGSRWYFGNSYNNPFWSNDMTTGPAGIGVECQGVNVAWWWRVDPQSDYDDTDGDGYIDQDCYMAVFTSETCDVQACLDDGTGSLLPGVIYMFVNLDVSSKFFGGFFVANIDLTGTALAHFMPSDGVGGHIVMYGTAFDPVSGQITLTTGEGDVWAQPMLWGTDEDEPPGGTLRVGTQAIIQYDEIDPDAPPPLECSDYTFGVCPDPLAPCIGFLYKGVDPCPCDGDANADGMIDAVDLAALLAVFGTPCPCPSPCVDANGDSTVDISDLALLLSQFGGGCP